MTCDVATEEYGEGVSLEHTYRKCADLWTVQKANVSKAL